jgi:hypothetical protein
MSHVQAYSELIQIKNNTTDNFFNGSAETEDLPYEQAALVSL